MQVDEEAAGHTGLTLLNLRKVALVSTGKAQLMTFAGLLVLLRVWKRLGSQIVDKQEREMELAWIMLDVEGMLTT